MNKRIAREIVERGITVGDLRATLKRAYEDGAANDKRSRLNKGCSKAVAFNIMVRGTKGEDSDKVPTHGIHTIGATNVLREFGKYWGGWTPELPKCRKQPRDYHHEEPIDISFSEIKEEDIPF